MTKRRIALFSSLMVGAALLCGAGVANAQSYGGDGPAPYDRSTDDRGYGDHGYSDQPETVIVRPDYDRVEKYQHLGRANGEINPVEYSTSRPVDFSDLDLSRRADRRELRIRVSDTARDLCAQIDSHIPAYLNDRDSDRECVRTATTNAMRDAFDR